MKCHRCGDRLTLRVVGDDYCAPCKVEIRQREEQDARRTARARFSVVKDTTPLYPGAA
jgi:hypothetical protein